MIHLVAGLAMAVAGAWGVIAWWDDFGALLRGFLPAWLVVVGLAAVASGLQNTAGGAEGREQDCERPDAEAFVRPRED